MFDPYFDWYFFVDDTIYLQCLECWYLGYVVEYVFEVVGLLDNRFLSERCNGDRSQGTILEKG